MWEFCAIQLSSNNNSSIDGDKQQRQCLSRLCPRQEAWLTNGTPGEMSSPASTSSLFNRLQLDDDLEDGRDPFASTETRDLFVTVDDPKKHVSTMETYITYRVSTKVCSWLSPADRDDLWPGSLLDVLNVSDVDVLFSKRLQIASLSHSWWTNMAACI